MQLEKAKDSVASKHEAHRIVCLFFHHITKNPEIWVFQFQREVGVPGFGASQEKSGMPLLWEVRCREYGAGTEVHRVRVAFVPEKAPMTICVENVLCGDLHAVQCTANCGWHVLFAPHYCTNGLVLCDDIEAICQNLW